MSAEGILCLLVGLFVVLVFVAVSLSERAYHRQLANRRAVACPGGPRPHRPGGGVLFRAARRGREADRIRAKANAETVIHVTPAQLSAWQEVMSRPAPEYGTGPERREAEVGLRFGFRAEHPRAGSGSGAEPQGGRS